MLGWDGMRTFSSSILRVRLSSLLLVPLSSRPSSSFARICSIRRHARPRRPRCCPARLCSFPGEAAALTPSELAIVTDYHLTRRLPQSVPGCALFVAFPSHLSPSSRRSHRGPRYDRHSSTTRSETLPKLTSDVSFVLSIAQNMHHLPRF